MLHSIPKKYVNLGELPGLSGCLPGFSSVERGSLRSSAALTFMSLLTLQVWGQRMALSMGRRSQGQGTSTVGWGGAKTSFSG